MLAMDVWCFSKSTIRVDLEKHQTRLHYWGNSLCNFEESPLQLWVFLLCTKHRKQRDYTGWIIHGTFFPVEWKLGGGMAMLCSSNWNKTDLAKKVEGAGTVYSLLWKRICCCGCYSPAGFGITGGIGSIYGGLFWF